MLTVVCETPGTLTVESAPIPVPGQARCAARQAGRHMRTDLHIFAGRQPYLNYPRVMGHELSATVVETPTGSPLAEGDAVYVMPYLSCGRCVACRLGRTNCCAHLEVLGVHRDGAFAEYLTVPEGFVHKAEGVTLDQAAMIEFLAIGAHAVRRAQVHAGQRVLVVGGPHRHGRNRLLEAAGRAVFALDSRADPWRSAETARHDRGRGAGPGKSTSSPRCRPTRSTSCSTRPATPRDGRDSGSCSRREYVNHLGVAGDHVQRRVHKAGARCIGSRNATTRISNRADSMPRPDKS